jgi:hypothetical protein
LFPCALPVIAAASTFGAETNLAFFIVSFWATHKVGLKYRVAVGALGDGLLSRLLFAGPLEVLDVLFECLLQSRMYNAYCNNILVNLKICLFLITSIGCRLCSVELQTFFSNISVLSV